MNEKWYFANLIFILYAALAYALIKIEFRKSFSVIDGWKILIVYSVIGILDYIMFYQSLAYMFVSILCGAIAVVLKDQHRRVSAASEFINYLGRFVLGTALAFIAIPLVTIEICYHNHRT